MNLVKIMVNDDGDNVDNPKWHIIGHYLDARRTLCGGEVFGYGSSNAKYEVKEGTMKDCDCNRCKAIVRWYKELK